MREQERSKALPVYPNSFPTILSPDCLRAFAHAIHSLNPHFISSSLKYFQLAVPDHSVKNNGSQRLPLSRPLLLLFSHWVVSHSLWPHGLQPPRLPCPSTISQSLLKLMSIESMMPSNRLILCCPLLLLPSIFPSIRVFSNESALRIKWPKC